jgi:hypothetical protein
VTPVRPACRACGVAVALAAAQGCSLLLVKGPSAGAAAPAASSCTRSNVAPFVDATLAGVALYTGGVLLAGGARSEGWAVGASVVGGGLVGEGLVFGVSSLIGFHRTARCRAAPAR